MRSSESLWRPQAYKWLFRIAFVFTVFFGVFFRLFFLLFARASSFRVSDDDVIAIDFVQMSWTSGPLRPAIGTMESSTRVLLCESSFWLWEPLIRSVRARNKNTCSHLKNGSLSILKKIHCELRDEVARTEGGRCPSHPPYKNFVFRIHTTGHKSKFHLRIF